MSNMGMDEGKSWDRHKETMKTKKKRDEVKKSGDECEQTSLHSIIL